LDACAAAAFNIQHAAFIIPHAELIVGFGLIFDIEHV
jgi:hypothetical protein